MKVQGLSWKVNSILKSFTWKMSLSKKKRRGGGVNIYLAHSKTISPHVTKVWLYVTNPCPKLPHYINMSRLTETGSSRPDTWGPKKTSTRRGIKSDFEVTLFAMVHSWDLTTLYQIPVIKESVYHTGNNYHFHSNVNYIYY